MLRQQITFFALLAFLLPCVLANHDHGSDHDKKIFNQAAKTWLNVNVGVEMVSSKIKVDDSPILYSADNLPAKEQYKKVEVKLSLKEKKKLDKDIALGESGRFYAHLLYEFVEDEAAYLKDSSKIQFEEPEINKDDRLWVYTFTIRHTL